MLEDLIALSVLVIPSTPAAFVVWPLNVFLICFFSCPLAQSALSWLQSLMFRFSSLSPSLVCRHVLFGFSPDEVRSIPRIFVYMLNVCRFSIWKVRNVFRFRDVPPGAFVVIEMVKSRMRFFLPLLFKHFKSPRPVLLYTSPSPRDA